MSYDEFEPIENLLRGQPLRKPSPDLDRRVWPAQRKRPVVWKRMAAGAAVAASLAAAAVLLVMVLVGGPFGARFRPAARPEVESALHVTPQPAANERAPIRIEQVWSSVATNEVVVPDDAPPLCRLHQQVVRHVRWIDERQHVEIEWNIPSEQTVLVPLEYN